MEVYVDVMVPLIRELEVRLTIHEVYINSFT